MGIILALFIFQAIPVTYADTTWLMYGSNLENTHYQKMVGAMADTPYVKWSYSTGAPIESYGASVADIDMDDTMEVVIGSNDRRVYCLNGITRRVKWSYPTGGMVDASPALADIDGDDTMEVIVGSKDKKVYCLNGVTGLPKWIYPTGGMIVCSSPAIADVNGDDTLEVVIGSNDYKVYCLNGITGKEVWIYPTGYQVWSSPAIADVDRDDTLEVVIGSRDDTVYCLNGITGIPEWTYATGAPIESSPAIADVNGDDTLEVVIGSKDNKVYCLNGVTGLRKWSYRTGGTVNSSPALADVDGDDTMEVVIGSTDGKVHCLNGVTSRVKWAYPPGLFPSGGSVHRGISVADLDGELSGECKLEVLVPSHFTDSLVCLNGENGSVLWIKQLANDVHDITIADIDNDGCVELIVGTQSGDKIWALDDIGNRTNCKCDGSNVEENGEPRVKSLEFRVIGKGIYLFTPNAIPVDIKLYDVCGRLQQILYKGVLTKGGHTFIPNIESNGIYFAVLRSHRLRQSLKIIRF